MKRTYILLFTVCLAITPGCIAHTLGVVAGTAIRLPFEVTGEVLEGFGEGFFGVSEKPVPSVTTPSIEEETPEIPERKLVRDKFGNIIY